MTSRLDRFFSRSLGFILLSHAPPNHLRFGGLFLPGAAVWNPFCNPQSGNARDRNEAIAVTPPRREGVLMTQAAHDQLPPLGLLKEVDDETRQRLAERGQFETLEPGTYLIRQGDNHHNISIIIFGYLGVSCHAHGDYVELAKLGPGHSVGEMSVLDPQKASADVRVLDQPARLWTIDGDEFKHFIDSDPATGYAIMTMLAKEMCRRLRQNSDHMLHQADELRTHFLDLDY